MISKRIIANGVKQAGKRLNYDFNLIKMIDMIICKTPPYSVGMNRSVETQTAPKDAFRMECNPYRKTFFYQAVMPDGIEIRNNENSHENHRSDSPDGFVPRHDALNKRNSVIAMSGAKKQSRRTANILNGFTAFARTWRHLSLTINH